MASWDHKASPHGNPQQAAVPRPTPQGPRPPLPLSSDDAWSIADALELLAGIDEGENTDFNELMRLAALVRERS